MKARYADQPTREAARMRLASTVIELAKQGMLDREQLKAMAIERCGGR